MNRMQRTVAETLNGPVLVLAGAGSGKTRALTYRVANLIDNGVSPRAILALTFTNKAAREMKERIGLLVGDDTAEEAWISTFHSSCARILRRDIEKIGYQRNFIIYDDDDQMSALKEIYKKLDIDDKIIPIREVKSKISDAKNKLLTPDEWYRRSVKDRRCDKIHDIMCVYTQRLKEMNALDFDDLIMKTLELFIENPPVLAYYRERFQYVLVDEYQDTNTAQYELVRLLTANSHNLCVVGDDDQSIYGWRGADIHNILDFENDYPDATVIRMEQNYRSTANILDAANQVISNNINRKDKALWTEAPAGDKIVLFCSQDERMEAAWIADNIRILERENTRPKDIAVLYRTNAQSRVIEEMLMRDGIGYRVFGGMKFYERKEVKDIIAYIRVIVNPADDVSLRRIINVPKRSIGDSTMAILEEYAAKQNIPLYAVLGNLPAELSTRARKNLTEFFEMMNLFQALSDVTPLEQFVSDMIERTGLAEQYTHEDTDEARSRIENINEFIGGVHDYATMNGNEATLSGYLENIALVTDQDTAEESRNGTVTLMTLHSAKGLEFAYVFIPGLEEGVFPGNRSADDQERLEEERRLMYVGITRTKKRLYLSRAEHRMLYNQFNHNPPSRFLAEIPERLIRNENFELLSSPGMRNTMQKGMPFSSVKANTVSRTDRSSGNTGKINGAGNKGFRLDEIPGITKGFSGSKVRNTAIDAAHQAYHSGDTVLHRKFGRGIVESISCKDGEERMVIVFDSYGRKELDPSIAPLTKLGE